MSMNENHTYFTSIRPYMIKHYKQIEEVRDKIKERIGSSLKDATIKCECGKDVRFASLRFHLSTAKHRKICGDFPDPCEPDIQSYQPPQSP